MLNAAMNVKVSQKGAVRQVVISICVGLPMFSLPIWGRAQMPVGTTDNAQEIVCIGSPVEAAPRVRYIKGSARHRTDTGSIVLNSDARLEAGNTISTGSDGFVRIQLSDRTYKNIHPNSLVVVGLVGCEQSLARPVKDVPHIAPYLSAAIRG